MRGRAAIANARAVLDGLEDTEATLALLPEVGVDLEAVAERLLADGLAAFDADLATLLATIEARLPPPSGRAAAPLRAGDAGGLGGGERAVKLAATLKSKNNHS